MFTLSPRQWTATGSTPAPAATGTFRLPNRAWAATGYGTGGEFRLRPRGWVAHAIQEAQPPSETVPTTTPDTLDDSASKDQGPLP